jgi:hypothetical protein
VFSATIHILNDGSLTVCCRDYDGDLIFGNIKDNSPEELINNEKILQLRKQHLENKIPTNLPCSNCYRIDPRVAFLFQLFVSTLINVYGEKWDVERMQVRFEKFFDGFLSGIPSQETFISLIK